jgi:hypothetical protein
LVAFINGGLVTYLTSFTLPDGTTVNGTGTSTTLTLAGWTIVVSSATLITITSPAGVPLTDFYSMGRSSALASAEWRTRSFVGVASSTYTIIQNVSYSTITINSITAANTGFAGAGSGDFYIVFWRAAQ